MDTLELIVVIWVLYALAFGLTVNGKHYGVTCDDKSGVSIGVTQMKDGCP